MSTKDINAFDNILMSVIRGDWGSDVLENMAGNSCSALICLLVAFLGFISD